MTSRIAEALQAQQETEDLIEQINELRGLLAACWRMVPDGYYGGAAMSKIKRGMTKYDCWPDQIDAAIAAAKGEPS